jgi:hypothetical protein
MNFPDKVSPKEQINNLEEDFVIAHAEQNITETQFNLLIRKYPTWKIRIIV